MRPVPAAVSMMVPLAENLMHSVLSRRAPSEG
jgi:hypothetical protein